MTPAQLEVYHLLNNFIDDGMTELQVATRLGVTEDEVFWWRRALNLPYGVKQGQVISGLHEMVIESQQSGGC